jgi:signal transduction histidine kinase
MEYNDIQKTKSENSLLKTQNELRQQRLIILIVSGVVILAMGICLVIFYRQNNIIARNLQKLRVKTEEKKLQQEQEEKALEEKKPEGLGPEMQEKQLQKEQQEKIREEKNLEELRPKIEEKKLQQEQQEKTREEKDIEQSGAKMEERKLQKEQQEKSLEEKNLEESGPKIEEKKLQQEQQEKIREEKDIEQSGAKMEERKLQKEQQEKSLEEKNLEEPGPELEEKELRQEQHEKNNGSGRISLKDKLIPMIVHDIRAPLASLENTLSLARENILNPEEFQKLSLTLEADIYNVRGMLDNMLLWTREQMMDIKINKAQFDLNEMVSGVILMHRNSLIVKNISVHNYLEAGIKVISDKEMLTAVFRNVFSNAVKFTEPGKNIYIHEIFFKHKIYISLKDEGQGISQDILDKINNKEHVSRRGTANEKGTGIGIMFSKDLLDKLGEQFDITSIPGKGTSVTFSVDISNGQNGEEPPLNLEIQS